MNKENIISAAQARLNFCDPEYVALYKEINNRILDESRNKTCICVDTEVNPTVRNRILSELESLGYNTNYYHKTDKLHTIVIRW